MQNNNKKNPVHYPRNAANSQLTTQKTYLEYIKSIETELETANKKIELAGGIFSAPQELIDQRDKI